MNFRKGMRGIVHVGANAGQEVSSYIEAGFSPILLVEPNPAHQRELFDAAADYRVLVAPVALGDQDETRKLWIPQRLDDKGDDDLSASFFRADHDSWYEWGERDKKGREIEVKVKRFDTLVQESPVLQKFIKEFNVLVVDVQGFEYEVLVGFGQYLKQFKYLQIECSDPPIYLGAKSTREVADYLETFGIHQTSSVTKTSNHGDEFFEGAA